MKFLVCVFVAAFATEILALTDEQKEQMAKTSRECREQTGVSQELIDKVRQGEFVEDLKLKEHILCVSKKVGLATETGEANVTLLKEKLKVVAKNSEEVEEIVRKCALKRETPEETAYLTFKCLREAKPKFSPI